jgi:hypothetical protein
VVLEEAVEPDFPEHPASSTTAPTQQLPRQQLPHRQVPHRQVPHQQVPHQLPRQVPPDLYVPARSETIEMFKLNNIGIYNGLNVLLFRMF